MRQRYGLKFEGKKKPPQFEVVLKIIEKYLQ